MEVSARTGIAQSRLSRAENGQALLSPDEVAELGRLYNADDEHGAQLARLTGEAHSDYVDARVVVQSGATANLQRRFGQLERNATEVRAFQPMIVLGVLQTEAYCAAVFGTDTGDRLVRQRLDRQRLMLRDERRHWTLVQTEGSLRWLVRSAALMIEQLEHLIELSRLPNVELGLVSWGTPVDFFPATAFHIYDRATAVVGTHDGTAIMTDLERVADYRSRFDRVRAAAVFGPRCRDRLAAIAEDYRDLPP